MISSHTGLLTNSEANDQVIQTRFDFENQLKGNQTNRIKFHKGHKLLDVVFQYPDSFKEGWEDKDMCRL